MEYRKAWEVEEVARGLIEEYHDHLNLVEVEYLMCKKTPKSKGRELPGRVRVISGLPAYLASEAGPGETWSPGEPFFLVEVAQLWWAAFTEEQRAGFIDHLLCHCKIDGDTGALVIEPPQFGEYPEVLERHGFWRPGDRFKEFAATVSEQLSLLPPEERVDAQTGEVLEGARW